MKNCILFLNELSFAFDGVMPTAEILQRVLSTLATIRAAKKIRNDIAIVGQARLAEIVFDNGTHSLASVLRGDTHREEWRFLRGLDQASPWETYSGHILADESQDLVYQGRIAVGMAWANRTGSPVVSFAFSPDWARDSVHGEFREMDETGNVISLNVSIPNLSNPEHAAVHRQIIKSYGGSVSSSSLVYEGVGFVIRMFFDDHDPPHFHVLLRKNASETLAKYAIETLDLMSGSLSATLRRTVEQWARERKDALRENWSRCRGGEHPLSLDS